MSSLHELPRTLTLCVLAGFFLVIASASRANAAPVLDEGIDHYDSIELGYAKDISDWIIEWVMDDYVDQAVNDYKRLNSDCFPRPNTILMPAISFKVRTRDEVWTKRFVAEIVKRYSKNELIVMWRNVARSFEGEKVDIFDLDKKRATTKVVKQFVSHLKYQIDWKLLPSVRKHCAERSPASP
ncbi:MAG: hypothetical protein AAFN27_11090 [Pseudomonadota bacterium]